ncbi:MAG: hypothetical protein ABJK28_11970 [Algibacter sp.]
MIFTTGYDWLDCIYFIVVLVGVALYVFKPWKEKTKEKIKDDKRIVNYWSKYGRNGYVTKCQKNFEINYWFFGFLVTFFPIILPWIFQELGWVSFRL